MDVAYASNLPLRFRLKDGVNSSRNLKESPYVNFGCVFVCYVVQSTAL